MIRTFSSLALLALATPTLAADPAPAPAPSEIVAAAPRADWVAIPASDLLVMDLAPDSKGKPRRVTIQLMPPPFSQGWIGNIRKLAAAHWWDGLSINRVQDNYVAQWGDAHGQDKAKARALPAGLKQMNEADYFVDADVLGEFTNSPAPIDAASLETKTAEEVFAEAMDSIAESPEQKRIALISINSTKTATAPDGWHERDSFAPWVEIWKGWPLGNIEVVHWENDDGKVVPAPEHPEVRSDTGPYRTVDSSVFWPVHCYGMVGVGRNLSPDTGSGAELYTVIGHAPRHLDRNIALVGRVIEGIEHLSSLPRGTGALGFYETAEERTKIRSIRLGTEVPALPAYEYLSTESETFARYADARANRRDPFFIKPAGGADICNIPVPVRRVK